MNLMNAGMSWIGATLVAIRLPAIKPSFAGESPQDDDGAIVMCKAESPFAKENALYLERGSPDQIKFCFQPITFLNAIAIKYELVIEKDADSEVVGSLNFKKAYLRQRPSP